MTLPRSCLSILRHRPIYRELARTSYHAIESGFRAFRNDRTRRRRDLYYQAIRERIRWSIKKADSADSVWISLAPEGFAVPFCAAIGYAEPRVGVTAEPMNNWSIGQLGCHALGPAPDRHGADGSAG